MRVDVVGITQQEYADHQGVSQPMVAKWLREGVIPRLPNGRLNPHECDRWLAHNTLRLRRPPWRRPRVRTRAAKALTPAPEVVDT